MHAWSPQCRRLARLRLQLHVERRRLAAPNLDVGEITDEALLPDLDVVPAFGEIDCQAIAAVAAPWRPVDQYFRVGRLQREGERAAAVVCVGLGRRGLSTWALGARRRRAREVLGTIRGE